MWLPSTAIMAAILMLRHTSAAPARRDDVFLEVEGSSIIEVPDSITMLSQPNPVTESVLYAQAGGPFGTPISTPTPAPEPTDDPGVFTVGTLTVTPFLSPQITQSAGVYLREQSVLNPSRSSSSPTLRPRFLRGVNLGGWLVVEKWMTPGLFTGPFSDSIDQWTFDSVPGAAAALQSHWSSFITEADIAKIAATGINALRIPIGFWAYDNTGTPYIKGADFFLERAIQWARAANLSVWIDCHGSPGSQNGYDNSGHAGSIEWQQDDNLKRSISVLKTIAEKYGTLNYADVVVAIELVNEPISSGNNTFTTTAAWAQEAYKAVRATAPNKLLDIVMHDAFEGPAAWIRTSQSIQAAEDPTAGGFAIDTHLYQLFRPSDNLLTQDAHIAAACSLSPSLSASNAVLPVFVGEFSAASNICLAPNGATSVAGTSCPPSMPGCECQAETPAQQWSDAMKLQVRRFVEAQMDVWEQSTRGWFLWSVKGPGAWGYLEGVQGGWIPSPVTSRMFPGQCDSGRRAAGA